jgi:hypothetical protein
VKEHTVVEFVCFSGVMKGSHESLSIWGLSEMTPSSRLVTAQSEIRRSAARTERYSVELETEWDEEARMIVNRLTVDGKDYFLPDPVDELRKQILEAVKAGGGYVNIPPLRGGKGVDILFSPGMPVTWVQLDIGEPANGTDGKSDHYVDSFDL